ncbi:MAG: DUF4215 domain-containing protein [Deltaproteobacteria bacterium]|nr:DUF4215 domain-containing protein [Deltaproteobacteria bacterium]
MNSSREHGLLGRNLLILSFLLSSFWACSPEIKDGYYSCDKDLPGSCPSGWICQNRGTDGVFRCYSKSAGYCGNNQLDPDEECDGYIFSPSSDCIENPEECKCADSSRVCDPESCTIYCSVCGDKKIEGLEQCDDGNTNENDGCSSECKVEKYCPEFNEDNSCTQYCGDGQTNGPELCDTEDMGLYSCQFFGFYEGELRCGENCLEFDTKYCMGYCGDSSITLDESCDGNSLPAKSCDDFGFESGFTTCTEFCQQRIENCHNKWPVNSLPEVIYASAQTGNFKYILTENCLYFYNNFQLETLVCTENLSFYSLAAQNHENVFISTLNGDLYKYDGNKLYSLGNATGFESILPMPICSNSTELFINYGEYFYRRNSMGINYLSGLPDLGSFTVNDIQCNEDGSGFVSGTNNGFIIEFQNNVFDVYDTLNENPVKKVIIKGDQYYYIQKTDTDNYGIFRLEYGVSALLFETELFIDDIKFFDDRLIAIIDRKLVNIDFPEHNIYYDEDLLDDSFSFMNFTELTVTKDAYSFTTQKYSTSNILENFHHLPEVKYLGNSLYLFMPEWRITDGKSVNDLPAPLPDIRVSSVLDNINGTNILHVGGNNGQGASWYDDHWEFWTIDQLSDSKITAMAVSSEGTLWVGSDSGKIFYKDSEIWVEKQISTSSKIDSINLDHSGFIYYTTEDNRFRSCNNISCTNPVLINFSASGTVSAKQYVLAWGKAGNTNNSVVLRCYEGSCTKVRIPDSDAFSKLEFIDSDYILAFFEYEYYLLKQTSTGWNKQLFPGITGMLYSCSSENCLHFSNESSTTIVATTNNREKLVSSKLGLYGLTHCGDDRIISLSDNDISKLEICGIANIAGYSVYRFLSPINGTLTINIDSTDEINGGIAVLRKEHDVSDLTCHEFQNFVEKSTQISIDVEHSVIYYIIVYSSENDNYSTVFKTNCLIN